MIKNFLHASNRLFKSKFPPNHNLGTKLPKYVKSRKTVLRRFVHSNNIVHFRKPTFNGLFQATCKRTQCCVRLHVASKALKCSNKTVNIGAMTSIILERDVHAERNADQHFDTKVNARQVGPHFGSNSPLYGKMPGVCLGSGRFWN